MHYPLQAERTASKADISRRLIAGLAGENERWAATVAEMEDEEGEAEGAGRMCECFALVGQGVWKSPLPAFTA